jgi:hypothetical protein
MIGDLEAFADEWIEAFNAKDLERMLSHYEEDVTLVSPRVKLMTGDPSCTVRGKNALRDYFDAALARSPNLKFTLKGIFPGVESVVLRLRASDGRDGAELLVFGKNGKVREVRAHWTVV